MFNNNRYLGVIPARGGSKGVARKNLREIAGKPLIAWTIETALKSEYLDRVILSSEDAEIIKTAEEFGCEVPFLRPPELSRDDTPGIEPVLHAVTELSGYDYVVLLQPTSPFRNEKDIDGGIAYAAEKKANVCMGVTLASKSPYWMYTLQPDGGMRPIIDPEDASGRPVRRQDLQDVYFINGAFYLAKVDWLKEHRTFLHQETIGYPMPGQRSLDIDSETDLKIADFLMRDRAP